MENKPTLQAKLKIEQLVDTQQVQTDGYEKDRDQFDTDHQEAFIGLDMLIGKGHKVRGHVGQPDHEVEQGRPTNM
jgi:hypothetical protein